MKSTKLSFAAAVLAVTSIMNTPQVAEAHHQGFWVTGRSCTDDGFGNLVNCWNEQVWATDHGALNCASDGYLPVFARGFGNSLQYRFCDFNW